jgi:hypothetical protein
MVFDGTITNDPGIATTAVAAATGPDRNIYSTGGVAGTCPAVTCSSAVNGGGGAAVGATLTRSGATLTLSFPTTFTNNGCGAANQLCLLPGGSLNIQGVRVNVSGLSGNVFSTLTTVPANAITFPGGLNATVVGRAQATIGGVTAFGPALGQCAFPLTPTLNSDGTLKTGQVLPLAGLFYVNVRAKQLPDVLLRRELA